MPSVFVFMGPPSLAPASPVVASGLLARRRISRLHGLKPIPVDGNGCFHRSTGPSADRGRAGTMESTLALVDPGCWEKKL